MQYRIRFRKRAKKELLIAKEYGNQFSEELDHWLQSIVEFPEGSTQSIDFLQLLEDGERVLLNELSWKSIWMKWWKLTPISKVRAMISTIKRRSPPWEMRCSSRWFTGILGSFDCEVCAVFEVDHVEHVVVFTLFTGLPGVGE